MDKSLLARALDKPALAVAAAPRDRFGGRARMIVAQVRFQRAMVLVPPADAERVRREGGAEGVWSLNLEPAPDHTTGS